MKHNPNHKGNAAELAIAAEAAELGLEVYLPATEHGRYDIVLGIAEKLYRVQCKWGARVGEKVQVRLHTSRYSPTRGYVTKTYDRTEIDLVAVYCGDLKTSYLLPPDLFEGRSHVWLRTGPPKNGQRAALNWAADYEFQGAVAQLAERSDGIRKVRGSIPLSSTLQPDAAPTVESVGAHQFRNHFGYYMDQAAQGTEVLVSRHGRPFVRLLGVGEPQEEAPERPQEIR